LRLPAKEMAAAHQAALKGDLDAMTRYAFEAVRLNALGPGVFRTAAEDYTFARGTPQATTIPKGARVLVALQSAMLDGDRFDRPQEFRLDRNLGDYISFGHGLHTCFGQHINQVQPPLIVQALLRLKKLRRAEGEDGKLQLEGTSPKSLWVEFEP
jgi:cytochrome P450